VASSNLKHHPLSSPLRLTMLSNESGNFHKPPVHPFSLWHVDGSAATIAALNRGVIVHDESESACHIRKTPTIWLVWSQTSQTFPDQPDVSTLSECEWRHNTLPMP
jgi:hypothetical protein